ncbi:MAG: hypothetical protein AB8G11_20025 [Saprospiraceae bacterium]
MKHISFLILVVLISVDSFGQKAITRSLSQTNKVNTTNTKTMLGAFGETLELQEATEDTKEVSKKQVRHFDLMEESSAEISDIEREAGISKSLSNANLKDVMVINERNPWNITPPKSEVFLFHDAKIITNESGFYIQLVESTEILDKEHEIYQEFGNLRVKTTINGEFRYLIGSFTNKDAGINFLNNIILPRYPKAKITKFENGNQL